MLGTMSKRNVGYCYDYDSELLDDSHVFQDNAKRQCLPPINHFDDILNPISFDDDLYDDYAESASAAAGNICPTSYHKPYDYGQSIGESPKYGRVSIDDLLLGPSQTGSYALSSTTSQQTEGWGIEYSASNTIPDPYTHALIHRENAVVPKTCFGMVSQYSIRSLILCKLSEG